MKSFKKKTVTQSLLEKHNDKNNALFANFKLAKFTKLKAIQKI